MTNNNDDFEHHDLGPTEGLPPPKAGLSDNLKAAWRERPLFKLVVLMTAVAAIVAASISFFSGGTPSQSSRLVTPPSINGAPGGPASPYMQQQTNLANQDRAREAMQNGGSALPTPIGQTTDLGALNSSEKKNDPLNELKAEVDRMRQEQRITQQQQVQQQQVQQQVVHQQETFDDSLANAMQRQMTQLMDSWTPHGVKSVMVANADVLKQVAAKESGVATTTTTTGPGGTTVTTTTGEPGAAGTTTTTQLPPKTIVQAGTVSYAQLLTEANSDVPGPILAQILSGPFAGARAVGQFQVANGYADYLVLQFTLVNFKGVDYAINGVALDPNTTLGGMATETDQRYFTRVVLPAAAGFLQGFGSSIGSGSSTVTTNGTTTIVSQSNQGIHQGIFQGLGQAAQTASQFFEEQANLIKPLVRVAANTPIGLFFVSSVTDTNAQNQTASMTSATALGGANGLPGSLPGGLPGTGAVPAGYQPNYGYTNGALAAANPYMSGMTYPGTTMTGYGGTTPNYAASGVPYPNYAGSSNPYSYQNSAYRGLVPSYYGH